MCRSGRRKTSVSLWKRTGQKQNVKRGASRAPGGIRKQRTLTGAEKHGRIPHPSPKMRNQLCVDDRDKQTGIDGTRKATSFKTHQTHAGDDRTKQNHPAVGTAERAARQCRPFLGDPFLCSFLRLSTADVYVLRLSELFIFFARQVIGPGSVRKVGFGGQVFY